MSALGLGGLLLLVWLLLWDTLTVANVVSGLIVVPLVLWFSPGTRFTVRKPVVRPVHALRFAGRIGYDLLLANAVVAREVLAKESSINTGIVEVPVPGVSPGLLTLVASVLSLSPGTMPIEVIDEPATMYIHVLHLRDVEAVRRDVQHLTALAVRAFGSDEAVAELDLLLANPATVAGPAGAAADGDEEVP